MGGTDYSSAVVAVRDDLQDTHWFLWEHLRSPGAWWTGTERVGMAKAARDAAACRLCLERKRALSPNAVRGAHDGDGSLPENVVEVVHRMRTDPARLSRAWFEERLGGGLTDAQYVEVIGVATLCAGADYFAGALGIAPVALPEPRHGEPSRAGSQH